MSRIGFARAERALAGSKGGSVSKILVYRYGHIRVSAHVQITSKGSGNSGVEYSGSQ